MIDIILYPLAIGLLFAEFSGIPQSFARWLAKKGFGISTLNGFYYANKLPYKLKPFGCGMCLTFWLSLTMSIFSANFALYTAIGNAAIASAIAYLIITVRDRINR